MAHFSTGLRNSILDNTGVRSLLAGGTLKIFSGTVPASADDAEAGTLLATYTLNGDGTTGLTFDAPAAGVLPKAAAEVWSTAAAAASGAAAYFRFVGSADTAAASATEPRVQGTVGTVGTDMVLASTAFVAGQPYTMKYMSIGLPTL